jgi:hypothetical protein
VNKTGKGLGTAVMSRGCYGQALHARGLSGSSLSWQGASIKERCNAVLRIIPKGICAAAPNNTISYATVATREGVKHYVKIYIQLRAVDHSARGSMKNAAKREN